MRCRAWASMTFQCQRRRSGSGKRFGRHQP